MSLTVIKKPGIILTKSPLEIRLKTTGALVSQGALAQAVVHIDGFLAAAEILQLEIGDEVLSFVFGTPDGDNPLLLTEFTTGDGVDYAPTFAADLYNHPFIAEHYKVEVMPSVAGGDGYVLITARERGADWVITLGAGTTCTMGADTDWGGAASDTFANTHEVIMRVKDEDENLIGELSATGVTNADTNEMSVTFHDAPQLLAPEAKGALPLEITTINAAPVHRVLPVEVYEKKDGVSKPIIDVATFRILGGGMPLSNFAADSVFSSFEDYGSNKRRFLTHQPRTKLITAEQPEWLSVYLAVAGVYFPNFTIYYSDGSSTIHTPVTGYTAPEPGVYTFPAGIDQNSLTAVTPAKTIVYYVFEIGLLASGIRSEPFTYILDTRYQRKHRYFVFLNSFGCPDTLRCIGVKEFNSKVTRTTTELAVSSESRPRDGALQMVYNELERSFTIRTGFIETRTELDWLNELLLSTEVAEIVLPLKYTSGDNAYLQPMHKCILTTDKMRMYDDNDFTLGGEFNLQYAVRDITHSAYTAPDEIFYDSELRCTMILEGSETVPIWTVSVNAGASAKVYVNGSAYNPGPITIPATAAVYDVVIKARNLTTVSFTIDDGNTTIVPTYINSRTLTSLHIGSDFAIDKTYLLSSLHRLRFLTTLRLASDDTWVNEALMFAAKLRSKYGRITNVRVDEMDGAPTGAGAAAKAYLIAQGATVTTD